MVLLCTISLFYNSNFALVELDTHQPIIEDVFKEDDEGPSPVKQDDVAEAIGGWTKVKEMDIDPSVLKAKKEEKVATYDII